MHGEDSATCPFLTIPPEVTAEIFTHCLPTSISPPDIDTAPLLLDRICRGWRKIVRSSPGLWTSLKVDGIHIPVALIETWLSRAQTMPLSLVLEVPDSEETQWDTAPVIAAVERYSGTWHDLSLDIPHTQLYLFRSDLPLPLLERLTIRTAFLPLMEPINAFRSASALRQLTLADIVHPTVLQLPWTQITSFESYSDYLRPDEFLAILQYTPNIEKCAATIYNRASDGLPDVPPLMFLASLTLGTQIPEVLDIFDNISVPTLQVLDLSNILFSGRELVARLHPILSKPDCQLRELIMIIQFDRFQPQEDDFIQLLQTQPALEKFELRTGSLCLPIAICRRLTDGSPFLPRLGTLVLSPSVFGVAEITATFPILLDLLTDALSTRWVAPSESFAPIHNFTLSWTGEARDVLQDLVAAFRPRQKELVALGINISVGREIQDHAKFT
jgi:hypothetical protein